MKKLTILGAGSVLGVIVLFYSYYGRHNGGAACAVRPKIVLAIDVDNTLGHTIPLTNLSAMEQSKLVEKGLILKHVYVVNRERDRKEYGYYRRLMAAPPTDGGLLLERIDDNHIRATENFALRPTMFHFLSSLGSDLTTFGKVRYLITSRGLDERIRSLVSSIPLPLDGERFGTRVQIAPRTSLRVEIEVDGKMLPGKSMSALWKNVFASKEGMIFIGIDDISADRFLLRPVSGDLLAQVNRFYYFDLLREGYMALDDHHLWKVKEDILERLRKNRQLTCPPHSQ